MRGDRDRRRLVDELGFESQAAGRGDVLGQRENVLLDRGHRFGGRAAELQGEIGPAGDDAERAGMQGGLSDGQHAAVVFCRHELGRPEREIGQPEKGVVAQLERRRPGMARFADVGALPVMFAGDPLDDADRDSSSSRTGPCSMWSST